jgi:hypothetical protein
VRTKSDAELDELSHNLGTLVGVAAEAELTRRRLRRTWMIGSILIALICAWALYATVVRDRKVASTQQVVDGNREAIEAARRFDHVSCARDRETIKQLRKIIADGKASLVNYRDEGLLSQAQYRRAVKASDDALQSLPPVHCPLPGR